MNKQLAVEKFNNLDIDNLDVKKTRWERLIWPMIKPLIRKYMIKAIEELFK